MSENGQAAAARKRGRPRLSAEAFDRARRLREQREAAGFSVTDMALRLGISTSAYRHLEQQVSQAQWQRHGQQIEQIFEGVVAGKAPASYPLIIACANHRAACDLARAAKARRMALELKLPEVAIAVGVSSATVRTWERVVPKWLTRDNLLRWAAALGVSEQWFLDGAVRRQDQPAHTKGMPHKDGDAPRVLMPLAAALVSCPQSA